MACALECSITTPFIDPLFTGLKEIRIKTIRLPFWGLIAYRDNKVRLTTWARELIYFLTARGVEIILECTDIPKALQFLTKRNLSDSFSGFVKCGFDGYGTPDERIPDALIECDSKGNFVLRTKRHSTAV